jgi:hypothetical protein
MRGSLVAGTSWVALAIAASACCMGPAFARDPAVSETNLKVTTTAGSADGESAWLGVAGLTAPLSPMWGVQGEAGVMGVDGDTSYGLAGHVFKRDPESYLAGVFLAYASEDEFSLEATRLGAEAEFYTGQVTILLKAGYQFSDIIEDTVFGEAELHWYASDNFRLAGGLSLQEDMTLGHADAEWMIGSTSLPGLALRASVTVGEDDYDSVMGGITWYFGSDASLKDRHRRQDPDSALFNLFHAVQDARVGLCEPVEQNMMKSGPSLDCNAPPPPPPPT